MNTTKLYTGIAVALVQSATVVCSVQAQQAQLEEIVVTAERREATLQETDISMSVFGENTLQEIGASSYYEVGDFAPNVKMHEMPGKMGAAVNIRGFRNAETIATFDPKVALYLDGVLISKNTGSAFDVMDLERVEILRGPQGTLYGRNTVGGAVNVITKRPYTDKFGGHFSVTVGDYNQQDVKGSLNIPLAENLAVKATLASLQRDGYWDDHPVPGLASDFDNGDVADKDREAGHLQILWEPTDNLSVYYSYDTIDINETGWAMVLSEFDPAIAPQLAPWAQDGGSDDRPYDFEQFMDGEADGHNLTIEWELNDDLELVSITGLRSFEVDNSQDSDGSPEFILHTLSGDEVENFTQEFRLVGTTMDSALDYVIGAYYMDEDIKEWYTNNVLPNFGYLESESFGDAQNKVWAIFAEGTYALTEKLDVTVGLRYTEEEREATRSDRTFIPAFPLNSVTPLPPAGPVDFNDVSGTLSFAYQWNEDIMTYAKLSKGYASGGFSPRAPDPQLFLDGFDEETVWNYELGWKTTWLDRRLLINGAVFFADYQDLQVTVITASGRGNISNASDAEIYGGEIEIQVRPTPNLELGAGYGYLHPEYKDYIDPVTGEDVGDVNQWPHSPENSFNAYGRYEVPEALLGGDLVFRLDYSWVDDFSLLAAPDNLVDGYDFVNGRVSLNNLRGPGNSRINIALWGRNLGDELYYTSGYRVSAFGFRALAAAAPRTYGLDLTLEF